MWAFAMVERGGPEGLVGRREIDGIEDAKGTIRRRAWFWSPSIDRRRD
jgi:hypothetical protein